MSGRLLTKDALAALYDMRDEEDVIVTTMATARDWMMLQQERGTNPRDLVYVPSSMSQATSVALGIALAQPARRVVVCNGDGSMLMNLGSLVTIAAADPKNLTVLLFVNGTYEVTGSQPTPAARVTRGGGVDYEALARASGFARVYHFVNLLEWRDAVREVIHQDGPTFALFDVQSEPGRPGPKSPGPAADRAKALMAALNPRSSTYSPPPARG